MLRQWNWGKDGKGFPKPMANHIIVFFCCQQSRIIRHQWTLGSHHLAFIVGSMAPHMARVLVTDGVKPVSILVVSQPTKLDPRNCFLLVIAISTIVCDPHLEAGQPTKRCHRPLGNACLLYPELSSPKTCRATIIHQHMISNTSFILRMSNHPYRNNNQLIDDIHH